MMPIAKFQMPDGRVARFEVAEGTTPEQAQAQIEALIASEGVPEAKPEVGLKGALGAAGTIASSIVAEPVAGLAGLAQGLNPFAEEGAANKAVADVREALTYMPKSEEGQQAVQNVGEFLEPVANALETAETTLGDGTLEVTGSPTLAAAAATAPTALMELLGVATAKGSISASRKAKAIANAKPDERVASILSASKANDVPVLTSDIFPPESYLGKHAQNLSEKLGVLGSGSDRESQQSARIQAVQALVEQEAIDLDTPFAESMVKSLNKKAASELQSAGRVRDEAITALDEFGEFENAKTLTAIDRIIDKQERLGATANKQLVSELDNYKQALSNSSDFAYKVDQRTQLIKKIKAFSRAEDTAPAAELQKVKAALDKDMVAFARVNDKTATRKWLAANRKFAEDYGVQKNTEIKRLLQSGEATPEKVIPILKGGKASELNRLYGALGEKGRLSARKALLQQALKDARYFEADANPNPNALATALNRANFQQAANVFFKGGDKAELDGLTRLLDATRRAQDSQVHIRTGETLLVPSLGAGAAGAVGAGALPALPVIGGALTLSRLLKAYESAPFRSLLIKIKNSKAGSKVENEHLLKAAAFVGAGSQAAKSAQEQDQ